MSKGGAGVDVSRDFRCEKIALSRTVEVGEFGRKLIIIELAVCLLIDTLIMN